MNLANITKAMLPRSHYWTTGLSVVLGFMLLALLAVCSYRRRPKWRTLDRLLLAAVPLCTVVFVLQIAERLTRAPSMYTNENRLLPTLALASGYGLYHYPGDGPLISTIYGPLTYLIYLPSVLFDSPTCVLVTAAAIAQFLYFLPVVLTMWQDSRRTPCQLLTSCLGLLAFASFTTVLPSLAVSSSRIHADAPALAFGALACMFVAAGFRNGSAARDLASGMCAVAAFGFKQNMLPLSAALPSYVLLVFGMRRFVRYTSLLFLASALGTAACWAFLSPLGPLVYNTLSVPRLHPYHPYKLLPAVAELTQQVREPLAIICALLGLAVVVRGKDWKAYLLAQPALAFFWAALWLTPAAIMGQMKAGGTANTLGPAVYFLVLACVLAITRHMADSDPKAFASSQIVKMVAGFYLVFIAATTLPGTIRGLVETTSSPNNTAEVIYAYCKMHPGMVYFPMNPVSTLLFERRLYHSEWGILDKHLAGYDLTERQFRCHTPSNFAFIAFPPGAAVRTLSARLAGPGRRVVNEELPGFEIYTVAPEGGR